MKKTMTSNNIPEKSTLNDIEREDSMFGGYSVSALDAFISGSKYAQDTKTGVIKVRLVKATPVKVEGGVDYFQLTWENLETEQKLYSRCYLDKRLVSWSDACDRRTCNGAWKLCKKFGRATPNVIDRLNVLLRSSEVLVNYDYYKESDKPILSLWLPSDFNKSRTTAGNYIPE